MNLLILLIPINFFIEMIEKIIKYIYLLKSKLLFFIFSYNTTFKLKEILHKNIKNNNYKILISDDYSNYDTFNFIRNQN
jgi:uncharacterized protein (UPF0303 family)